jgi:23S rRNA (cytosine1962-C5)-methyltransferase
MISNGYELVDSGQGAKLERFGERLIVRPSSHAIWQRRSPDAWKGVSATYGESGKWSGPKSGPGQGWALQGDGFTMSLTLLDNGQVGIFPEHASYLSELREECLALKAQGIEPALLNLFAYTGMCSVVAAKAGANVTHVDISKTILDWATDNFSKNNLSGIRLIKEDALSFMRKEVRRGKKYNFIVVDPPGFSRSKDFSWNIEEIISELAQLVADLLNRDNGRAYVTFHGGELHPETVRNILLDKGNFSAESVTVRSLTLKDQAGRCLPAGALIKVAL